MRVLFVGDIVGKGGRKAVRSLVPSLREEYGCSFCVANGENMAGGAGMTRKCLQQLEDSTVEVFTGGDHMWDQKDFVQDIAGISNVLRPANACSSQPGRGYDVFTDGNGRRIGVICLQGRVFLNSLADCPFAAADRICQELKEQTDAIIIDFHAEATSEKIAMGRYLDGRASAVLGTHTHVATADQMILPHRTAYQTDVGMVGARESILGRSIEAVVHRFRTGMPARFTVVNETIRLNATVITLDDAGRATGIERVVRDLS